MSKDTKSIIWALVIIFVLLPLLFAVIGFIALKSNQESNIDQFNNF
jgi:hypothetical protein